jgi:DNA modification methylase
VTLDAYRSFLEAKAGLSPSLGLQVSAEEVNPILKPHQRACVEWAVRGGRRALFEAFGLGKTVQQLEILRLILAKLGPGHRALIVAPLGVRQEFRRDAEMLGVSIRFVRTTAECGTDGLYLTNYESVREGKLDMGAFDAVSLDEAGCLRGFGGTKTFREFMRLAEGNARLRFRFVATATPSPNEYIELLAYAAFLEIMDVGQAKTRFFGRNSEKADDLTIYPHKEEEFWLWINSWAIFLQSPSDLGYSDEGYALPPLDVRWHEIPTNHSTAGADRDGQSRLFKNAALGVVDASREKRETLAARVEKLLELRAEDPDAHRLIWHDLEAERLAIEAAIPGVVTVYGAQDLETREQAIIDFSAGRIAELASKPVLSGSGCNFQRHCSWAIFLGIGFKFHDFVQAIHRVQRFLQPNRVRIDLIYTEAEREVRRILEEKWHRHEELVRKMTRIIREYRLNQDAMAEKLTRTIGCDRVEVESEAGGWRLVNNDCVDEVRRMADGSVDLIVTSIPFSTQYEYTPSYNDFGHTDDDGHFWRQMDFLTPELLRVLEPGRVAAVHVKDRITPGGINGLGFQTVSPFHCDAIAHFRRHGFAFLGMKTVVTDVVRENNQTYRLGWTEQCKDGSRMGVGTPEYVLLFRRPPTDRSNGYADVPVVKTKRIRTGDGWQPGDGTGYSRARWQLDAHAFTRSSGNRLLMPEEIVGLDADVVYKVFKRHSLTNVYEFEQHVRLAEALEERDCLPPTFMLLPPASWHDDVWADVARMRTLNMNQERQGREAHLCPLQFDIVDRLIAQFSMPGEVVFDPFAGIGTVPRQAILAGRKGWGVELNPGYFADACIYAEAAANQVATPSLFDLLEEEETCEPGTKTA